MNGLPSRPLMANLCGNGPTAIQFGYAAEPIVDLVHGDAAPLYCECLARMIVAEDVLLRPGDFVEDLERSGDIALLDGAMADLVMDELVGNPDIRLGCNVSPRTLADADGWALLMRRIGEHTQSASRLTLEITESFPLNEIDGAAERLQEAKRFGCRLAIDDFGAGFATSANFQGVDVEWDIIKIDRSCFGDLCKVLSGHDGLRSLVQLAKSLAPVVVIEGIETKKHLTLARRAGVQFGQGWMYGGLGHHRWSVPDEDIGERLFAAVAARAAVFRRSTCDEPEG